METINRDERRIALLENPKLFIDVETVCNENIKGYNSHTYTRLPSFRVSLIAYALENEEVRIIDMFEEMRSEETLKDLKGMLLNTNITKVAHNSNFDRQALNRELKINSNYCKWIDTSAIARSANLPSSLERLSSVLCENYRKKSDEKTKEAKKLFFTNEDNYNRNKFFCPEQFETFVLYNRYDVESLREVFQRLDSLGYVNAFQWETYFLDQKINYDIGLPVRNDNAEALEEEILQVKVKAFTEIMHITGVENPNSASQMKKFFFDTLGEEIKFLSKKKRKWMFNSLRKENVKPVKEILYLHDISKMTVPSKIETLRRNLYRKKRLFEHLKFHGAFTGRWTSRIFNVQNLGANAKSEDVSLAYTSKLRSLIKPIDNSLVSCDFSAIENRIMAYYTKDKSLLEMYSSHKDPYILLYSMVSGIEEEKVSKEQRKQAKIWLLALGYGMGEKSFSDRLVGEGLSPAEAARIFNKLRKVVFRGMEMFKENLFNSFIRVLASPKGGFSLKVGDLAVKKEPDVGCIGNNVSIKLLSGRKIYFRNLKKESANCLTHEVFARSSKESSFVRNTQLISFVCQATGVDILANAMRNLDKEGFSIIMTVHDEVLVNSSNVEKIEEIMRKPPVWWDSNILALECQGEVMEDGIWRK